MRALGMIITLDGPAGAGKSTVARELARRLNFQFLDTGAMYRAVGWKCLHERVLLENREQIAACAQGVSIAFDGNRVLCNGMDVTSEIRSSEVTSAASKVAVVPVVREEMVRLQREAAAGKNMVTEGRDQGTVVFPEAEFKFFLTASVEERARRRMSDLVAQGEIVSQDQLIKEIAERDHRDSTRAIAPLRPAEDAEIIDTSSLDLEQVLQNLEQRIRARLKQE